MKMPKSINSIRCSELIKLLTDINLKPLITWDSPAENNSLVFETLIENQSFEFKVDNRGHWFYKYKGEYYAFCEPNEKLLLVERIKSLNKQINGN